MTKSIVWFVFLIGIAAAPWACSNALSATKRVRSAAYLAKGACVAYKTQSNPEPDLDAFCKIILGEPLDCNELVKDGGK